jgi:crotonobetaine/carnitine-CoA ligase
MDPRFPARDAVVTADLIERFARETPEKTFVVFEDEEWSYARMAEEAWAMAQGLIELGLEQDGAVISWLPNGPHAMRAWFGANAAGAIYAPINPAFRGSILAHTINYSEGEIMIAPAGLLERLDGLELERLKTVVVVGLGEGEACPEGPAGIRTIAWSDAIRPGAPRPELSRPVEPWDIMAIIYTSGTTGPSKAVLCPYLHHHTYCEQLQPDATAADRFFACLPMFHAGGTTSIFGMLRHGASVAVTEGFRTQTFLAEVKKYEITLGTILGAMATFLSKREPSPEDRDHKMRKAIVTPMIADVPAFRERFGIDVYAAYGLTEGTCPLRSELNPSNSETCGKLTSGAYDLRLVDEFDREVAVGEVGELIMRHQTPWALNAGYRGMPEATAKAWRNGWFHTGDALRRDEEGNYYFVDRLKDALRRRGENVSSMEVESEIVSHPDVIEVAVVAAPSEDMEDEIKASVVFREGSGLTAETLSDWLVPRLPYFMVPRYFEVLDELPKTETQKVQKFELRARGVSEACWDREAAGIRLKRERVAT